MTLLAGEALKITEHVLAGSVHPAITGLRVLNDTGQWLVSTRPWVYLRGGMDALDITAGEDFVALPQDFGGIITVARSESFTPSFILTTLEEMMRLRTYTPAVSSFTFWGSVTYDHADITGTASSSGAYSVTATTEAEIKAKKKPTPRLDLYPMPGDTTTGALLLYYTRGWRKVEEDTDTIFVPEWLEGLYLRAARIWARGYEEEDTFDKDAALANLQLGPEYKAAIVRDSQIQVDKGLIQGGATQKLGWYRNYDGPVGDPS